VQGILATYQIIPKDYGFEARFELLNLLHDISKNFPELERAKVVMRPGGFKGILLADLRDALAEVEPERLELIREEVWKEFRRRKSENAIRYIQRFIVLDAIVETDIDKIAEAVRKLKDKVKGKWRITLKTRKYPIDRNLLIKKAAEPITLPVDLENPEYIVLIEILGNMTAIAILKQEENL